MKLTVVAGGQCQCPPGEIPLWRIRMRPERLCRCLSPSLSSPFEPGVALGTGLLEVTSTRMGTAGLSHCSTMALLSCPKRMLVSCPSSSCLLLTQTSVHILPSSSQQLVPGQWGLDAKAADTRSTLCFLGGSRITLHLVSPPPGLFSPVPEFIPLYLPQGLLITQMPVVFVGFHPLLIKPIFIQYTVCECG